MEIETVLKTIDKLKTEEEVVEYKREFEREMCKNSLSFLCQNVLGYKDWDVCHDDLTKFLTSSKKRFKLILMPRGHLKSSIITIGYTIQKVLNDFDSTVLLTNAIWDKSRSFLNTIKEYLTNKSKLPDLFGKFEDEKGWKADSIIIAQRKTPLHTQTIDTAGVEKSTTGYHYKTIIHDDLVDRQNISTADQIEKVRKVYIDSLDLLEPNGEMIIIGTMWDERDLYNYLIKKESDKFDVYKTMATNNGKVYGKVLFPKKFTNDILSDLLKSKGSREFYAQYMNEITSSETMIFKPPVRRWNIENSEFMKSVITFDPATSEKKESCEAVVMCSGFNQSSQLCVLGYTIFREHEKNPFLMINKIFDYVSRFRCKDVVVETNGGQEVYVHLLNDESKKRKVSINIIEVHQHRSKESRILALQPYWERGDLLLKEGMIELEEQLEMFRIPIVSNVDILDALAMRIQEEIPLSINRFIKQEKNNNKFGWIDGCYIPPTPNQILSDYPNELISNGG